MKTAARIELLEKQHRELDKEIQTAYKKYFPDHQVNEMKSRKFNLKAEITKLKGLDNNE